MYKKSILGLSIILALFACHCTSSWARNKGLDKVGYVDVKRLMLESEAGKQAAVEMAKIQKRLHAELEKKKDEVMQLKALIEKEGPSWSVEKRRDKIDTYENEVKVLDRMVTDTREQLKREDQRMAQDVLRKVEPAVRKVAADRGYSIVLKDPSVIGYLNPKVDITDDVLLLLQKNR